VNLEIEKLPEFDNHELVSFFFDKKTGLKGFLAIHNTNLGPALGATRFWHYQSEEEALLDALRLSRGMAYKCALARLPYGGGKGVIMADEKMTKTPEMIRAYAKVIDNLHGRFYTGEDVGMNKNDVRLMAEKTSYVIGKIPNKSDNPPYWTALGVLSAALAGLEEINGIPQVRNTTFAIKGLGKVGSQLCKMVIENGGSVIAADINSRKTKLATKNFPSIKIVSPSVIHRQEVDIFASCALGGCLNQITIPELKCKVVCGGANNQLANPEDGVRLHRRKILYIPDYLANSGGLINVVAELRPGGYSQSWVEKKCHQIQATTKKIISLSRRYNKPTSVVADRLAEKMFNGKSR